MALALLEVLGFENGNVRFNIDTGTNRYYQVKVGRSVQRKSGINWVDEVYYATPVAINAAGGGLLSSSKEIAIPVSRFDRGNAYVQLISFKTPEGKSPAISRVTNLPMGFAVPAPIDFASSLSSPATMNNNIACSFQRPRKIPARTYSDTYARAASLEDLLAGIVKVAGPALLNLLAGAKNGQGQNPSPAAAGSIAGADPTGVLAVLLKSILGNVPGTVGLAASQQQSLIDPAVQSNRFDHSRSSVLAESFIFGIDDAILAGLVSTVLPAVIGPITQALPQLLNAANQQRVQMKQADNKLTADILSDVNRRLLIDRLLQAQRQSPEATSPNGADDFNQLVQLLQQLPAAPPQPAPATGAPQTAAAPVSAARSLSRSVRDASILSSKAVVSFVTADPVSWNEMPKVLFVKNRALQLKLRLDVVEPAPKNPLPKAILRVVFKNGADQSIWFEKTFKQKNILPNSVMPLSFLPEELAHLPLNKPIVVLAEMRWLSSNGSREYKAIGSSEIILVNKYSLKEQGNGVSAEQELTDMTRFRPFWNKVWESPPLDRAGSDEDSEKKYLWELNVNAKYAVLLSAEHAANGLMGTKILRAPADEESLSANTEGRMKAGIELSISELNKLCPLWDGTPALDQAKLEAFNTEAFAKNNATEIIYNFRLKGRANERGMIWVVPVFKLFNFTLHVVQGTDEAGQVVAVTEEPAQFPLPVAARVIGLKSKQ